jgi:DNA-binding MarR family transcriptional regulator
MVLETTYTVMDRLGDELQREQGMPIRWYDVLLHLEEAPDARLRMTDLAAQILHSKSGLTRLVDTMEDAGLVRRERLTSDRRGIDVVMTAAGLEALHAARRIHRRGIQQYFARHLRDEDVKALARALEQVHREARTLRAPEGRS